jgi:hypothetical protein
MGCLFYSTCVFNYKSLLMFKHILHPKNVAFIFNKIISFYCEAAHDDCCEIQKSHAFIFCELRHNFFLKLYLLKIQCSFKTKTTPTNIHFKYVTLFTLLLFNVEVKSKLIRRSNRISFCRSALRHCYGKHVN